jgi:hypothetical protein
MGIHTSKSYYELNLRFLDAQNKSTQSRVIDYYHRKKGQFWNFYKQLRFTVCLKYAIDEVITCYICIPPRVVLAAMIINDVT